MWNKFSVSSFWESWWMTLSPGPTTLTWFVRSPVASISFVAFLGFSLSLSFFSTSSLTFFPFLTTAMLSGLDALRVKHFVWKFCWTLLAVLSVIDAEITLLLLLVDRLAGFTSVKRLLSNLYDAGPTINKIVVRFLSSFVMLLAWKQNWRHSTYVMGPIIVESWKVADNRCCHHGSLTAPLSPVCDVRMWATTLSDQRKMDNSITTKDPTHF